MTPSTTSDNSAPAGLDAGEQAIARALMRAHARARLKETPVLGVVVAGLAALTSAAIGPVAALSWAGAVAAAFLPALVIARATLRRAPAPDLIRASELLLGAGWAGIGLMALWAEPRPEGAGALFVTAVLAMALNMVINRHSRLALVTGVLVPGLSATLGLLLMPGTPWPLAVGTLGAAVALGRLGLDLHEAARHQAIQLYEEQREAAEKSAEWRALEQRRVDAERANQAKSHFLATMSHELRTPLNAILGFAEVLKSELLGRHTVPQYRDYASDIHASGQHLLTLINELLDLSRIEAGRYELCEEPLHLADVADDCRRMVEMKARSRGIHFSISVAALPPLRGDERAVRQVLINLCSNAVKFTPAGGRIEMRIAPSADGGQLVAVRDTGSGLSREELSAVRSARRVVPLAERRPEQGAGLGLSIVMRIMAMHQGRFDIFSREGVGTEAIVTFPRGRVLEAAPLQAAS